MLRKQVLFSMNILFTKRVSVNDLLDIWFSYCMILLTKR